jgi:hypothetical protein
MADLVVARRAEGFARPAAVALSLAAQALD